MYRLCGGSVLVTHLGTSVHVSVLYVALEQMAMDLFRVVNVIMRLTLMMMVNDD